MLPCINKHGICGHQEKSTQSPIPVHSQLEQLVAQRTAELEEIIAQLRSRQQQLGAQLHHDELTGLANRKLLQDRFSAQWSGPNATAIALRF